MKYIIYQPNIVDKEIKEIAAIIVDSKLEVIDKFHAPVTPLQSFKVLYTGFLQWMKNTYKTDPNIVFYGWGLIPKKITNKECKKYDLKTPWPAFQYKDIRIMLSSQLRIKPRKIENMVKLLEINFDKNKNTLVEAVYMINILRKISLKDVL